MKLVTYSDGAARGNPGPAGAGGIIIAENGDILKELSKYLGVATNNIAEYEALIMVLEQAHAFNASEIEIRADSELMVKQLNGEYRVKNEGLRPLYQRVMALLLPYSSVSINHIYRSDNKHADDLANRAIDNGYK